MANSYLTSNKIKMYPSAFRNHSIDPESYLSTEYNLTHTKYLSEEKALNSWVMTDIKNSNYLIIYLGGYFFKCLQSDILAMFSSSSNVYANIKLKEENATAGSSIVYQNRRLANLDSGSRSDLDYNSNFQGLGFTNETIGNLTVDQFEIKVLEKVGNDWIIPSTSRLKLSTNEIKDSSGNPISTKLTTSEVETSSIVMPSGSILNATANNVSNSITLKLNSGTTEGTNMFTFDGSSAKTVDITPSTINASISTHTHGNITSGGSLQETGVVIANNDKLVVTDNSNGDKIAKTSTSFDGATSTKFLTKKGEFEDISASALATYSSSQTQKMLTVTGGAMSWINVPASATIGDGKIKIGSTNIFSANTSNDLGLVAGDNVNLNYSNGSLTVSATDTVYGAATSSNLGLIKTGYTESGDNYAVNLDGNSKAYVTVPDMSYTLPASTSSALGGIKIGYSTSSKNYAVQLDANNCAYVNVPWSNTTYSAGNQLSLSGTKFNVSSTPTFTSVTAGSFNATSDVRKKENIEDYASSKSILDLQVKKFDFIEGPKNQIGCLAQDLQEICPEIVVEDGFGYLSIQESKIVYLLLEEVKKLREEVNNIKRG